MEPRGRMTGLCWRTGCNEDTGGDMPVAYRVILFWAQEVFHCGK